MALTKAGAVFTELLLETFRFNGLLLAAGDRLAKPLGLTSSRWQVLGAIEGQSLSVSQIAKKMGLTRQNVQRIADVLDQEDFVHYVPNPAHQRAKLVCLTPKGTRIMRQLGELQAVWANRTASNIAAADIRTAQRTMNKLATRLEEDESAQQ
jgi:DNA-binding MarR family transcriptional regulator